MSEVQKDLAELLREHRGGVTLRDASRQFGELIDAALELEASGSLTVKIAVKPEDEGTSLAVTVDVASAPPRPPKGSAMFYARGGTLVPFDEPPRSSEADRSLETQAAMAVHASSNEEDRRQARS